MTKRFNLFKACLITSCVALTASCNANSEKPNVLFIIADDLGYADLSSYGGRTTQTPNIDQLAGEGMAFSQAYAGASVCSPSRLSLITGNYPGRLRAGLEEPIATRDDVGLDPAQPNLAKAFQQAGYFTSLVGKWHLGFGEKFSPTKSGYDSFFGIHAGGTDYFEHKFNLFGKEMGHLYEGEEIAETSGYITDLFTERAKKDIDKAVSQNQPFFMSLHYTAPHWPWEGPQDHDVVPESPQHFTGGSLATYQVMLDSLDQAVGQVMEHLSAQGLDKNTIVVFASDNGGERFSDNWPLIGMKAELLEGGIRIPLIVRWPEHIAAGSQSEQVISLMDFFPTLTSLVGINEGVPSQLDGINQSAVLLGKTAIIERDIFWRHEGNTQGAIRSGDWKYLTLNGHEFLFNLADDQRERANLSSLYPEKFEQLKQRYQTWEKTMLAYPDDNYSHTLMGAKYADHYLSQ